MRIKKLSKNAAALAVVMACAGAFGLTACMDSSDPMEGSPSVDFMALTQQPPKPGNSPCGGVCDIEPEAGDSFRCVTMAAGVETCVPAKELLCSNNVDDDMDGKKDCGDPDCAANPACVVCVPSCDNKQCGDNGCGSVCGTCSDDKVCNNQGQCEVSLPPPASEVCDDGIDNDGDSKVDVADPDCATKTVATFSVCVKAGETATISVVAGSGESIEGNYPGGFCYPFTINGADAYAKVWARSAWRKFVSDHTFVVWDDGVSAAPPGWPLGQGIPVSGSYASASAGVQWVNFYVAGATE